MQIDPDLTLEKAKRMVRQREAVQEQRGILQGGMQPALFAVRRVNTQPRKPTKYLPIGGPRWRSSVTNKQCSRCGKGPHTRQSCHSCQKKGHYSSHCFTNSVGSVATALSEIDDETAYFNTITSSSTTKLWNCNVALDGQEVTFKIDTGAEVTVISESVAQQFELKKPKISQKKLCRSQIPVSSG